MEPADFVRNRLWIFPPGLPHGWRGVAEEGCEVLVFHFDRLPEQLERAVRERRCFSLPFTADEIGILDRIARELVPVLREPDGLSGLRFDRALLDISLLVLQKIPGGRGAPEFDRARQRVVNAETWYTEHMTRGPGVRDAAEAVYCSESHLRRLFMEVRGSSPQRVFIGLQIERARELLIQGDLPAAGVARLCGFSDQSSFSRTFRRETGLSPREWLRERQHPRLNPGE